MGSDRKLNLVGIPWPISILKCSRRVDEMLPGEQMTVALKDADTKDNIVMLLRTIPDVAFDVCETAECFFMNIQKRATP